MTGYPTIDVGKRGSIVMAKRLPAGTYPVVELPPGVVLREATCPTCHGKGAVILMRPHGPGPCVPCTDCRGVGGFPVLWAPCDTCELNEGGGFYPTDDEGNRVPGDLVCSAGCVGGMKPIGTIIKAGSGGWLTTYTPATKDQDVLVIPVGTPKETERDG